MATTCETYLFVFRGLLSGVMCMIGLFGNALSIAVLRKIGGASVTYFLLGVLAIVDTVYLLAYIPAVVVPEFFYFTGDGMALLYSYQYVIWGLFPIASMALTATVWVTTLVTVHRYVAISRPTEKYAMSTMKGAVLQVSVVVLCSILVDAPKYFESEVITLDTGNGTYVKTISVTRLWKNKTYQLVYKNIAMVGIRKILPIAITFVLTVFLVRLIVKRKRRREKLFHNGKTEQNPKQSKRLSYVLISIASVLILCQTPMAIYPLFRLFFTIDTEGCSHFYYYFSNFADWLGVVNSAVNFFIYYPAVPTFRQQLVGIFSFLPGGAGKHGEDSRPLSKGQNGQDSPKGVPETTNITSSSKV